MPHRSIGRLLVVLLVAGAVIGIGGGDEALAWCPDRDAYDSCYDLYTFYPVACYIYDQNFRCCYAECYSPFYETTLWAFWHWCGCTPE
jgi:hypothetical protein